MKINKIIFAACFAVSVFNISCNSNDDTISQSSQGLYYFTNLDQYIGFVNLNSPVIKASNAHSGGYVNLVDTSNRCGFTFNMVKQNISANKLKEVLVTCWIYSEDVNPDCSIVCSADTGGTRVYHYDSYKASKDFANSKEWTKVSHTFILPDTLPGFVSIKVYPFNNTQKPIYMDDLSVQFSEKQ